MNAFWFVIEHAPFFLIGSMLMVAYVVSGRRYALSIIPSALERARKRDPAIWPKSNQVNEGALERQNRRVLTEYIITLIFWPACLLWNRLTWDVPRHIEAVSGRDNDRFELESRQAAIEAKKQEEDRQAKEIRELHTVISDKDKMIERLKRQRDGSLVPLTDPEQQFLIEIAIAFERRESRRNR